MTHLSTECVLCGYHMKVYWLFLSNTLQTTLKLIKIASLQFITDIFLPVNNNLIPFCFTGGDDKKADVGAPGNANFQFVSFF